MQTILNRWQLLKNVIFCFWSIFSFSSSCCQGIMRHEESKKKKIINAPQVVIIFYICFVQVHVKNTGWRLRSRLYAWMASWTLAVVNLRHKLFIQSHTCPSMLYDRAISYSNTKNVWCACCCFLMGCIAFTFFLEVSVWPLTFAHSS